MGKASFCTNPLHINRIRGWYQRPSITYLNHLPMQNAFSNLQLDILCIFETLPLESKVKLMYYQNRTRGDDTLLKKKNKKCFRNAVNVIMEVGDKNVNFKLRIIVIN